MLIVPTVGGRPPAYSPADEYLLGTAANVGSMSGMLKQFSDGIYNLRRGGRPYGSLRARVSVPAERYAPSQAPIKRSGSPRCIRRDTTIRRYGNQFGRVTQLSA